MATECEELTMEWAAKRITALEDENAAIRAEAKSWNDNLPQRLKDAEADGLRLHAEKMEQWHRAEAAEAKVKAIHRVDTHLWKFIGWPENGKTIYDSVVEKVQLHQDTADALYNTCKERDRLREAYKENIKEAIKEILAIQRSGIGHGDINTRLLVLADKMNTNYLKAALSAQEPNKKP